LPAFARPTDRPPGLTVAFWRDGQQLERRHAADGEDALSAAYEILSHVDRLRDRDRLTVEADAPDRI
jgi:hypothetical protein